VYHYLRLLKHKSATLDLCVIDLTSYYSECRLNAVAKYTTVKLFTRSKPSHQFRTLYIVFRGFPSVWTSSLWSRRARASGVSRWANMPFMTSDSRRSCDRTYATTPETKAISG
jgi:hypothetical protein